MKNVALILLIILISAGCKKETAQNNGPVKIAIITTADLQSQVIPENKEVNGENISVGGLARIAHLASAIRQTADQSLLLSSGDDMIGAIYEFMNGQPEMEGMTMAGYDVVTPGNHEFDYGADHYKDALAYAGFDLVSSNLEFSDPQMASFFHPAVIKMLGNIRVGIFGLMTPDFPYITSPGPDVTINTNFVGVAEDKVSWLKAQNCDLIIALTHLGSELDEELAQKVDGIDIIVGGHSHNIFYDVVDKGNGKKTIIVNDGVRATNLGVLDLTWENGIITGHNWQTLLLDSTVASNADIQQQMDDYMNRYQDSTNVEIGTTTVDLDGRESTVRKKESNLGDFICDAWLDWFPDADFAILNGGSVRGDKVYPAGPLAYSALLEMLPFANDIFKVELKGSDIYKILEIDASTLHVAGDGCPEGQRPGSGGFLQVGGLKVVIDTTQQPFCAIYNGHQVSDILNEGSRIVSVKIRHNGNWIDPDTTATYVCLTNSWLAGGGDGYYVFLDPGVILHNTTMLDIVPVTAYLKKHTPVSSQTDGRITFGER